MEAIKKLLAAWFRKLIFAGGAVWLTKLIEAGALTQADVDRFIEIAIAAAMIVGPALWTTIKTWVLKKLEK